MKKILLFAFLACMFVSCSSDSSREIQIDEVTFAPEPNRESPEKYSELSTIFEVVPGSYKISWRVIDDVPQLKNYDVQLNLRLRLKRHVNIIPELYDKAINNDVYFPPFSFILLDADGKYDTLKCGVQELNIAYLPLDVMRENSGKRLDTDKYIDFLKFLASEPGTEIDVVVGALGTENTIVDCIKGIKETKGVKCIMTDTNEGFEKRIGKIQ